VAKRDSEVFRAVLSGEYVISGFRNRDIQERLYGTPPRSPDEAKRRCAGVSRLIAKLRGHGLVAKVRDRRRYHVSSLGRRVMAAALRFRDVEFPTALAA